MDMDLRNVKMKVYIAKHRETGNLWGARKFVYESKGGLKASWKTCWHGSNHSPNLQDEHDIYSYELKDGTLED